MGGVNLAGMWASGGDELLRKLWPDPDVQKQEIMRRIGVAMDTLERRAELLGLARQCRVDYLAPQVREMAATMTSEQIAERLGVYVTLVRTVLARHGIKAQRRESPQRHRPEFIAAARRLWDEGLSTVVIGERLGVTKNAIIGMAHRHQFPSRQSPIRRTEGVAPKSSYAARKHRRALKHMSNAQIAERRETQPTRRVQPKPKQEARVVYLGRVKECCWPTGKRLECGAQSVPNKPYCDEHCALAYKDWQPRRAAAVVSEADTPAVSVDDSSLDLPDASNGVGHLLGETRVQDHAEAA